MAKHSDATVRAAERYVYQKCFGDPRLLLALPPKVRARCLIALKICKEDREAKTKGDDNGTATGQGTDHGGSGAD